MWCLAAMWAKITGAKYYIQRKIVTGQEELPGKQFIVMSNKEHTCKPSYS